MRGRWFAIGLIFITIPTFFLLLNWVGVEILNDFITSIILSQALTAYLIGALIFGGILFVDKFR